jgi:hypothetical protein
MTLVGIGRLGRCRAVDVVDQQLHSHPWPLV